mmetsp:Transcript_29430/g.77363  ORF Transcript_29430/g.77363 Transcript_29430/m.77363 type:complete len:512 (+) Transcript_29430:796-2331(+)
MGGERKAEVVRTAEMEGRWQRDLVGDRGWEGDLVRGGGHGVGAGHRGLLRLEGEVGKKGKESASGGTAQATRLGRCPPAAASTLCSLHFAPSRHSLPRPRPHISRPTSSFTHHVHHRLPFRRQHTQERVHLNTRRSPLPVSAATSCAPTHLPLPHVLQPPGLVGQRPPPQDQVAREPTLRVEHGEGVVLVLHAEVHEAGVRVEHDALVQPGRVQAVVGHEPQLLGHEGQVVAVARAEDDCVKAGAVQAALEGGIAAAHGREHGHLLDGGRPAVAHGRGAVADDDARRAELDQLQRNVLGGVAAADDEDALAGELSRVAEVVGVEDAAGERLETVEGGDVGHREVARGDEDVVVLRDRNLGGLCVLRADGEDAGGGVEGHVADDGVEVDKALEVVLGGAREDVVAEDLAARIRRGGLASVLVEGVVGVLEALLGAVGPEVVVHARVDGLARAVHARLPGEVPLSAPVVALLEADDVELFLLCIVEGAKSGEAGGTGADDGDSCFLHDVFSGL